MLWICNGCSTAYSADAPCCPHCGSREYRLSTDPDPAVVDERGPMLGARDGDDGMPEGKAKAGSDA